MIEKLNFQIEINANKEKVWEKMLSDEGYRIWTSAFNSNGSWYEKEYKGALVPGEKVKFLGPDGEGKIGGMLSQVEAVGKHEFIYFKHYGFVMNGIELTDTPEIKAWAPACENYTFTEIGNSTKVEIYIEVAAEWSAMMKDSWPKALLVLKDICEN